MSIYTPTGRYVEDITEHKKLFRNDLELLANKIDEVLGFNLIPPMVKRPLNGQSGTLQQFKESTKIAAIFRTEHWQDVVDCSEIVKAAVFDYLIGAKDRSNHNFMIDEAKRKIWLIDHDYYMFFYGDRSNILRKAVDKGLTELSEEVKSAIKNLLRKIDLILDPNAKPQILEILGDIKSRAEHLIATGTLA